MLRACVHRATGSVRASSFNGAKRGLRRGQKGVLRRKRLLASREAEKMRRKLQTRGQKSAESTWGEMARHIRSIYLRNGSPSAFRHDLIHFLLVRIPAKMLLSTYLGVGVSLEVTLDSPSPFAHVRINAFIYVMVAPPVVLQA